MRDERFRESLPLELADDIKKYLKNPSCKCNLPIYKRIMKNCRDQIRDYFPGKEIEDVKKLDDLERKWAVVNCSIQELAKKLQTMPACLQLNLSRYEDQVTVVMGNFDLALTNTWSVINCHIDEAEGKIKSLPFGQKQIALARYKDQITVVVNEIDLFN
jgi:hypothetical protein